MKKNEEDEGFEIDFDKVISNAKNYKKFLIPIGILLIIGFTWFVRTQSVPNMQGEFLLGLDPYVFMRYAGEIVENGQVPLNDTMRYYPSGFDTSRELLMPSYATAVIYYVMNIFSETTINQAAIIYPAIVTCIAMIFFFLFTKEMFGNKIAFLSSMLLAVVNGFVFRTSAGFTEKESIAVLFLFALVYFYLKAYKNKEVKKKIIYSILGGFFVMGAMLSWGGINFTFIGLGATFLVSIIIGKSTRKDSIVYLIMILSIMSTTFLVGRYGDYFDVFKSYMFIWFPIALFLNLFKYEIFPKIKEYIIKYKPKKLNEHLFSVFTGFLFLLIAGLIVLGPTFFINFTNFIFERLNNPFGTDAFAMSVNENQQPYFYDPNGRVDWWTPMNFTFFTMALGSFFLFYEMFKGFKKQKLLITSFYILTLLLFIFSRFSTSSEYASINTFFSQSILGLQLHHIILFIFLGYMVYFFIKNLENFENFKTIRKEFLFLFFWFFITAIGARGGVRIIFAVCPPAMILSGYFFIKAYEWVSNFVDSKTFAGIIIGIIFGILFYYNFSTASLTNANFYPSFNAEWDAGMDWVKENTPEDSVFAHWWDYGYWVQTMGERATTLDGGNFDVELNHLTGRYLFASKVYENGTYDMTEPATTLDQVFGRPDYFLIIDDDVLKYVQMGRIGKKPTYYTIGYYGEQIENTLDQNYFNNEEMQYGLSNSSMFDSLLIFNSYYGAFPLQETFNYNDFIYQNGGNTVIYNVLYPFNSITGEMSNTPYGVVQNAYFSQQYYIIPFNCYCVYEEDCYTIRNDGIPECPLLLEDGMVMMTQNASDTLFTYLYLLNKDVPGFELVYDNQRPLLVQGMYDQTITDMKIYQINYTELEPFVLDEPLISYWTEEGGSYW